MEHFARPAWMDIREPTRRRHEQNMADGSKDLLAALWKQHPRIIARLTGKALGL